MNIIPFTKLGFENIQKDLDSLNLRRPDAVKTLSRARDMGDLSENGLYKAAKQEVVDIDRQIRNLKYLIKSAKVYSPTGNQTIQIGHRVFVNINGNKKEFFLVGEYEANPTEHKISNKSPIGYALMGKSAGETIQVKTPNGFIKYEIISIEE